MNYARTGPKPTWWLLYMTGVLLVALVALAEVFIPAGALRGLMEIVIVLAMFWLAALWIRRNRIALDLEQTRRRWLA
jgi:hypothetical protein